MNYQSDCLCGGECQKPCIAIRQLREEQERQQEEDDDKEISNKP